MDSRKWWCPSTQNKYKSFHKASSRRSPLYHSVVWWLCDDDSASCARLRDNCALTNFLSRRSSFWPVSRLEYRRSWPIVDRINTSVKALVCSSSTELEAQTESKCTMAHMVLVCASLDCESQISPNLNSAFSFTRNSIANRRTRLIKSTLLRRINTFKSAHARTESARMRFASSSVKSSNKTLTWDWSDDARAWYKRWIDWKMKIVELSWRQNNEK